MSADGQQFLDSLSSIPLHLRRYTDHVADFVDRNVDYAAHLVRETLATSQWVPETIRPSLPASAAPAGAVSGAASRVDCIQAWLARHKLLTSLVVVICGTVAVSNYQSNRSFRRARRAKRNRSGGRKEVIVIAGSPTLPLTKSLSLDLDRRGFIVYVVCNAAEDQRMVQTFSRPDIRPLSIDTTDPPSAGAAIDRFASMLQNPQLPVALPSSANLTLKGVVLIPSLHYQTSPIATIPPSSFADLFNTHLLQPILTIQAFLPLLTSRLIPIGEKWVPPKVLVFTPSIISSINPPFHAPEATVCSALTAFTEVLTAELRPLGIPVTHVQLGTFDFSSFVSSQSALTSSSGRQGMLAWPDGARHVYGHNFLAQTSSAISGGRIRGLKGSSLRHLHNAVFDVLDGSITSATVRVGLGSSVYGFVGRWVPRCLVSWMMGVRRVDELSTWKSSCNDGSSRDESEDDDAAAIISSRDFVPDASEQNVWNTDTADSSIWVPSTKEMN
ncbi:hypothetical protein CDD81_4468 [Ophiocordyceps australis]|uniref:DUF1776-domain-containing protein n=1 Tax=Ophiocordyceps australis TaxID=1399860 RepID=A0A2C5YHH6_9HYPO|nr:hypothetical protein CDD81_4468 [Ophiocordyceps australis]